MAQKSQNTFMGKVVKSESNKPHTWKTIARADVLPSEIKKIIKITVHPSDYGEGKFYAKIHIKSGYITEPIDMEVKVKEGDQLDPKSIYRVKKQNIKSGKEIIRLRGTVIKDD